MIHKIKAMHDNGKGLKIRAIARKLGISRTTVKKYLRMDEETIQQAQSDKDRNKKLDSQRQYIIHILKEFEGMSAVKVLRRVREKCPQIEVSDRTARRYINEVKKSVNLKQPRYYEPVLEMVPGVQCQVDGGELRGLSVSGEEITLYFVVFVLSYSRLMYVGLSSEPIDTGKFIQMHDAAFRYFGGRPEECVYDQAKLVVIHEQYRELELNQQFHAYATAAKFRIHACEGYDPESKGKVEAGVKYVKQNALYGERFDSWSGLEAYMDDWLNNIANKRTHGTTGEQPIIRYERDEKQHMGDYLTPEYMMVQAKAKESRKADKTGLISWKSNKYSVPMAWQRAHVGVTVSAEQLIISDLDSGKEIARHGLSYDNGKTIVNRDHYRDKQQSIASFEQTVQDKLGKEDGDKLCQLLKASQSRIYKAQLEGLCGLLKRYEFPPTLVRHLCDRSSLATSKIKELAEAYQAHPARFNADLPEIQTKDKATSEQLSRYTNMSEMEVRYDNLH